MFLNIDLRKQCEFFGFTENHENESILIFHGCSTNLNVDGDSVGDYITDCNELHIGNTPRSIMTKGTSTRRKNRLPGYLYRNFDPGNEDKLMISYRRERSHDYRMDSACGVSYKGEMHFFGGKRWWNRDYSRQHFSIETRRSEQLVKLLKKEDLTIGFEDSSCSIFANAVILCFDFDHSQSCHLFDDKLTYIGDSKYNHDFGGLTRYKHSLLTIGGLIDGNQKTEMMKRNKNGTFTWSVVEPNFQFSADDAISDHSLVTIESNDMHDEYVLLIGGYAADTSKDVFKFNGTWSSFGQLNKPRYYHKSIYWDGAVYVIGGIHNEYDQNTKMEIWKIDDSPDHFQTTEKWPELFNWQVPHLFIVPDSFFPDH